MDRFRQAPTLIIASTIRSFVATQLATNSSYAPAASVVTRQPILKAANFWTASYVMLSSGMVKSMALYPLNFRASSMVAASRTVVMDRRMILQLLVLLARTTAGVQAAGTTRQAAARRATAVEATIRDSMTACVK